VDVFNNIDDDTASLVFADIVDDVSGMALLGKNTLFWDDCFSAASNALSVDDKVGEGPE